MVIFTRMKLIESLLFAIWFGMMQLVMSDDPNWIFQSAEKWNEEWKSGSWNYMEDIAIERSKTAVIGGVYAKIFSRPDASVLDIGCGEGGISDYLNSAQKSKYVGIDISSEAIGIAKKKRPGIKFIDIAANIYSPSQKFDVIIFSEVLYYLPYESMIKKYIDILSDDGIMIISIFQKDNKMIYENIFNAARSLLNKIDEVELAGETRKKKDGVKLKTAFHVEIYKKK